MADRDATKREYVEIDAGKRAEKGSKGLIKRETWKKHRKRE
jgi:hypothetical protein